MSDDTRLADGAYILVYVRSRFWGERVGDGSERTPYVRDPATVSVAKSLFRGEPIDPAPLAE